MNSRKWNRRLLFKSKKFKYIFFFPFFKWIFEHIPFSPRKQKLSNGNFPLPSFRIFPCLTEDLTDQKSVTRHRIMNNSSPVSRVDDDVFLAAPWRCIYTAPSGDRFQGMLAKWRTMHACGTRRWEYARRGTVDTCETTAASSPRKQFYPRL